MTEQQQTARSTSTLLPWAGLLLLVLTGLRTISHASFWGHLVAGRTVVQGGIPRADTLSFLEPAGAWIQGSWLYDAVLYLLYQAGGPALVTLAHVALVAAAFLILLPAARVRSTPTATALALVLCSLLLAPSFNAQPATAVLLFAAIFCAVLSVPRKTWVFFAALVPVQVLWTNMHSSFLLGPIFVALALLQATQGKKRGEEPEGPSVHTAALLLLSCLVATLINPYGIRLITSLGTTWNDMSETPQLFMQSPFTHLFSIGSPNLLLYLALAVSAGGLVAYKDRLPTLFTGAAVLTAFLAMMSNQAPIHFAVVAFPFLALSLTAVGQSLRQLVQGNQEQAPTWTGPAAVALTLLLVLVSILSLMTNNFYRNQASASRFGLGEESALYPSQIAELVEHPAFPEHALNLPRDGAYLAWTYPDRKIALDQRAAVFGPELYRRVNEALLGVDPAKWTALESEYGLGAVILNACHHLGPEAALLLLQRGYGLAYFDGSTLVLLKQAPEYAPLLEDKALQARALELLETSRQTYLAEAGSGRAGLSPRLIGAAAMFMKLNRSQEAQALYELLTAVTPHMSTGWFSLGVAAFQNQDMEQAQTALETATGQVKNNPLSWLWLHRVYKETKQSSKAATALQKARTLDGALTEQILEAWGLLKTKNAPAETE